MELIICIHYQHSGHPLLPQPLCHPNNFAKNRIWNKNEIVYTLSNVHVYTLLNK